MISLEVTKTRTGALQVIALTTSGGEPYTVPEVHREVFNFDVGDKVSRVGEKVFEWVAGELERQSGPAPTFGSVEEFIIATVGGRPGIRPTELIGVGLSARVTGPEVRREMERLIDAERLVVGAGFGLSLPALGAK